MERRIDLTFMDGELFDAHQHEDGDPNGDGPFVNLDSTRAGKARRWTIHADGYAVTVSVTPTTTYRHRSAAHTHGGHA